MGYCGRSCGILFCYNLTYYCGSFGLVSWDVVVFYIGVIWHIIVCYLGIVAWVIMTGIVACYFAIIWHISVGHLGWCPGMLRYCTLG